MLVGFVCSVGVLGQDIIAVLENVWKPSTVVGGQLSKYNRPQNNADGINGNYLTNAIEINGINYSYVNTIIFLIMAINNNCYKLIFSILCNNFAILNCCNCT